MKQQQITCWCLTSCHGSDDKEWPTAHRCHSYLWRKLCHSIPLFWEKGKRQKKKKKKKKKTWRRAVCDIDRTVHSVHTLFIATLTKPSPCVWCEGATHRCFCMCWAMEAAEKDGKKPSEAQLNHKSHVKYRIHVKNKKKTIKFSLLSKTEKRHTAGIASNPGPHRHRVYNRQKEASLQQDWTKLIMLTASFFYLCWRGEHIWFPTRTEWSKKKKNKRHQTKM